MGLDIPVFQAYQGTEPPRFASQAELECAKVLDYYGVPWLYEPRTFPLRWAADGRPIESFTPDFYLIDHDFFVELTTLKQSLVTKKNRKLRLLRTLYPDVRIKLFYGRDFKSLMIKYGLKAGWSASDPERLAQHFRLDLAS